MIEFIRTGKTYPNGVQGLKDVSLKIDQGEFVAIIGLSGAGKSTLIRTINRMIDVTDGQVLVDGVDVMTLRGKTLRRFRRHIGMVFQSFNLVTRSTVIKNVLTSMVPDMDFLSVLFGIFTKKQELAALAALDKVGILEKAYTRCDQLSGGQQQRVALARTLNQNPTIILADEPVAALDPVTANQVMNDFKRINREMNITILINIHHVDLALEFADRVIGIREGRIVYDGPVEQVTDDILDEIYSGAHIPKAIDSLCDADIQDKVKKADTPGQKEALV
ncbi:MAG: phosphonate ABC transporter ATP-binding protein [Bacillota bacterium]